jgi:transposase
MARPSASLISAPSARPLEVRLTRDVPYPPEAVRSVTVVNQGRRLFVQVNAEIPVTEPALDHEVIVGVDLGVIHPYAAVVDGEALVCSGRALRAEEFLLMTDRKARSRKMAPKRAVRVDQP